MSAKKMVPVPCQRPSGHSVQRIVPAFARALSVTFLPWESSCSVDTAGKGRFSSLFEDGLISSWQ